MVVPTVLTIINLGIVFALSLLFGFARQRWHKPIGFGTFIFVALGACALAIVATNIGESPIPLLGAIVTGIGFLGAGALIKGTDKAYGFTSAATIWLFAIFGMVVGLGEYLLAGLIYALSWIVVLIDLHFEKHSIGAYQKKITLTTKKLITTNELDKVFAGYKHKLLGIEVNKNEDKVIMSLMIEGSKDQINHLSRELLNQPWFGSCKVE